MFPDGSRDMLALVPLAPLDEAVVADRLPDGLVQTASPVGHEENPVVEGEPSINEIPQESLYRLVVLGGGFDEAERNLLPLYGSPQGHHRLLACFAKSVHDQGYQVHFLQRASQRTPPGPWRSAQ